MKMRTSAPCQTGRSTGTVGLVCCSSSFRRGASSRCVCRGQPCGSDAHPDHGRSSEETILGGPDCLRHQGRHATQAYSRSRHTLDDDAVAEVFKPSLGVDPSSFDGGKPCHATYTTPHHTTPHHSTLSPPPLAQTYSDCALGLQGHDRPGPCCRTGPHQGATQVYAA